MNIKIGISLRAMKAHLFFCKSNAQITMNRIINSNHCINVYFDYNQFFLCKTVKFQ